MHNSKTINVTVNLQGYFCNDWPCVEISGNNYIYFTGNVQQTQVIKFPMPAQEINQITIKHKNKNFGTGGIWDTAVQEGVIVQDRAVKLLDLELDDVSIKSYTFDHCRFITDQNEILQTDYFGHNGCFIVEFGVPVYEWIICNCIKPKVKIDPSDFVINTTAGNLFDYNQDLVELDEIEGILNQHAHLFNQFTKI
jgi:hypothetical protein